MSKKKPTKGIVYVLTNPAMEDYVKIGKTTNLKKRIKDLSGTSVPFSFQCVFAMEVEDMNAVEKSMHAHFEKERVGNKRKEFFEIAAEKAVSALRISTGKDVTPRESVAEDKDDIVAVERATRRNSQFSFPMVGLKPGAELTYTRNKEVKAEVHDHKKIKFEGKVMSMTAAARKLLSREGIKWKAVAGPDYWKYGEEVLPQMRKRIEEESAEDD